MKSRTKEKVRNRRGLRPRSEGKRGRKGSGRWWRDTCSSGGVRGNEKAKRGLQDGRVGGAEGVGNGWVEKRRRNGEKGLNGGIAQRRKRVSGREKKLEEARWREGE